MAALRPARAARSHLDPLAQHHGRLRLAARVGARPVLRRRGRAAPPRASAHARGRREPDRRELRLLHDGAPLGRLPRRRPAGLPPLDALELLREVGLLRPADRPAREGAHDRLDRAPPAHAVARVGRAAAGRLRRGAQPAGCGRDGVRAPRHAVLAPVPGLFQRSRRRAGEQALDKRGLARAPPERVGRGVPELHRPGPRPWQRAYYGSNLARLRAIKKQVDPDFRFRFPQAIPPAR